MICYRSFTAMATVFFACLFLAGAAYAQSPTVTTDKEDYAPGETVIVTGAGWQPGETVALHIEEEPVFDGGHNFTAVADADGNIYNNQFLIEERHLGVTFTLTATGQNSGWTAQTTFTDYPSVGSVSVGPQSPTPVNAGNTATYQVTVVRGPASDPFSASLSIISSLPPGVSYTFSPPVVSFAPGQPAASSTLILFTSSFTPGGTAGFNLRATNTTNSGDYAIASATLTVSVCAPPSIIGMSGNQTVCSGSPAFFSISGTGTGLTFQWRKNGGNLSNGGNISGANSPALNIYPASTSDAGTYDVRITGTCGTVFSPTRSLTVNTAPVVTTNPNNQTVCEGSSVSFTAASSGNPTPVVQWQVEDGSGFTNISGATSMTLTFTASASQNGNQYRAVFTNTCGSVNSNAATLTVSGNQAPVANADGPYTADLGSSVMLNGTGSSDPNAGCGDAIVAYDWDLDNNGSVDFTGATPTIAASLIDALGVSSHSIALRVTDTFGLSGTATTTLTIYDNRPFARFTANPNPAGCNQSISFDASSSSHGRPDRSIVSYSWDFGDGGTATGMSVTHAYSAFGTYTATLTVTDDNVPPKTATSSVIIDVSQGNQPPVARAGGPYTADLGSSVVLNGTGSSDPNAGCGDAIVAYNWDLDNNGSVDFTGVAPTIAASIIDALGVSSHQIRLTVTDEFGASGTASTTLAIYDNSPIARITANPNPAGCNQSITFDASGSSHGRPDRAIVSYGWDFGDGGSATGKVVTHAYSSFGTYTATLTVTDDNVPPKTATSSVIIDVSQGNQPPVARAGGPYTADLGSSVVLNGTGSSDPDAGCGDGIVTYEWLVAGTLSLTGPTPTLTATQIEALGVGSHQIRLTVTDEFGASGTATTILTVNSTVTANAGNDAAICLGASANLNGTATGGNGSYTFAWTVQSGPNLSQSQFNNPALEDPIFTPTLAGIYVLRITVDNGVASPVFDEVQITVNPAPTATVSGDAMICAGSSTPIQAALTGDAPWDLTWSDGYVQNGVTTSSATRNVSPAANTVYTITSLNDANCLGTPSGSATVTVNPISVVANAGADLATATGVSAKLGGNPTGSGAGTLSHNWSPATGLSSNTAANPTATPSTTTTYTLTVTDQNNCTATDQVTVRAGNLVNSRIKLIIGPTNVYDPPPLNRVRVDMGIKNISGAPIYGPLTAVFKTLTPGPPTITIPNADGGGEGLGSYYDYSTLLGPDNVLSPGETTSFKLWIFQEHVTPAVNFKFFANITGDLDNVPKTAADDQPLAFSFDLPKAAVQDDSDAKASGSDLEIPVTYALHQNHPNPFNPSTSMQFDLPERGEVTLKIYNSVGQLVRTLVSGNYEAGAHKAVWDARNDGGELVTSGVYLAVFKAGEVQQVRRVLLMK